MARFNDSAKDGGKVKKWLDGATEALVSKLGSKTSKEAKDSKDSTDSKDAQPSEKPKHGLRSTNIEHHFDESSTVRHRPYEGDEISYATKDIDELVDKVGKYLSGEGDNLPVADRQTSEQSPEQFSTNGIAG